MLHLTNGEPHQQGDGLCESSELIDVLAGGMGALIDDVNSAKTDG